MSKPILCVDFDGVIHSYESGWVGVDVIPDPPVKGAMAWLLGALEHFRVHIYSSRSSNIGGLAAMREWFQEWADKELQKPQADKLTREIVFASEKPAAFLTIDDRALTFEGKWSEFDAKELLQFKPWNKQ